MLEQYVESSFEALFPSHEALATDPYDALSDVIERIGILNHDSSLTRSIEQSRPSQKVP